jgi:predicted dienelactone hydrolase
LGQRDNALPAIDGINLPADFAVSPPDVVAVDRNLSIAHEFRVVPNSGHFAFFAPCPPAIATEVPEICADAPGFDRVAFHKQFDADVLVFFRSQLTKASP